MAGTLSWLFWVLAGALALAGAALGCWALLADRSRGRRRCPRCWYDLGGSAGLQCSECGHLAGSERHLRRTRRRWRWAALAAVILIAAYLAAVTPRVRHRMQFASSQSAWAAVVPTTVLLALAPWTDIDGVLSSELGWRIFSGHGAWGWQQVLYGRLWASRYRKAESATVRARALQAIGLVGPEARSLLPVVFEALDTDEPAVRANAAYALGMIIEEPESSVPALVELLEDEDTKVRRMAAWAMWKFGDAAAGAEPALTKALGDASALVRTQSAVALSRIADDPRVAVPFLVEALGSADPGEPITAALALNALDPDVEGVVPALIEALNHVDARVRFWAVRRLAEVGPAASAAVPALIERLDDQMYDIDAWAASALGEIGPAAAAAVPALEARAGADGRPTAQVMAEALKKIRHDRRGRN